MKILICDDEGIVRQSLQFIIEKNFGNECELEFAKNGRTAIEIAESFRPDIVFMDIQMPGINGIAAMQEIRKENKNIIFIVLTAYDKFEYSQKSINIGVMSYLTKPINKDILTDTLRRAMKTVEDRKEKLSQDLKIKEKLETVIPLIENGFVYNMMLESNGTENEYRELLDIKEENGYVMVIECGDEFHKGKLTNTVGSGIKLQKHYLYFREVIKEITKGIVGAIMANKVIIMIPSTQEKEDYNGRVLKIENTRSMLRTLEKQTGLKFKAGIGTVKTWDKMSESYREARDVVKQEVGKVLHAGDIPVKCLYEESYPYEVEQALFQALEKGREEEIRKYSRQIVDWMEGHQEELNGVSRLKAMEFVLAAEHAAYMQGGMVYRFASREGYLETLLEFQDYRELKEWFVEKMIDAGRHIGNSQQEKEDNVVEKAKDYIQEHFDRNISLEEMARSIGISPYYLSKLFKENEGVNYIEYVTGLRIEYAKEQLTKSDKSIKQICRESGYGDPNYFSRIFKKWTGFTPTDYREER